MTLHRFPLTLLLTIAAGCSSGAVNGTSTTTVDSIFATRVAAGQPGCAVGLYRDGAPVLMKAYGVTDLESRRPLTVHSLFGLGSGSKQFTALATLTLADRGRLALDDDIRRYLPELSDYGTAIRIRDLLQHTSGIRDYGVLSELSGRNVATLPEFLGLIAGQGSLNFTPGTRHEYSHSDYLLLGAIIERVTKQAFGDYLEREILAPLGMTESRVHDARSIAIPERVFGHVTTRDSLRMVFPYSRIAGGNNLYASVTDLARWDHALDEAAAGRLPLVAKLMERPTLANGDTIPYAFGIRKGRYRGVPMFVRGANDRGTRSEVIRFPAQRVGVAVLCNRDDVPPGNVGTQVAEAYLGDAMTPRAVEFKAPPASEIPAAQLARYAGFYRARADDDDVDRFDVIDGKLVERLGDTLQTFTHRGNGKFTGDGSPEAFMVEFVDNGTAAPVQAQFTASGKPDGDPMFRMREAEIWKPTPIAVREYAGKWFSADVESIWAIDVVGDVLTLKRRGAQDITLLPIRPDYFSVLIGGWQGMTAHVHFERDASGAIARLSVSGESPHEGVVRNLMFARVRQ